MAKGTTQVPVPPIGSHADGKIISSEIGLIRTPVHRFAAIEPDSSNSCLIETDFVPASDNALYINADSTKGSIRVQISDHQGNPIDKFSFDKCIPIQKNSTKIEVKWNNASLTELVGGIDQIVCCGPVIRLSFILDNSQLYAFHFGKL